LCDIEKNSDVLDETSVAETVVDETPVTETLMEDATENKTPENIFIEDENELEVAPEDIECVEIVRSVELQKGIISYLRDLVFGLTFVLLVFMLIFRVVVVSGPSMMETLHDGDSLILLSNMFYKNPKYGDVVVASKDSFKDGEPIIKRVIATEGQTVDIDFESGIVYVDGEPLDEPYTKTPTNYQEGMKFPLTVSKGCVFVMGDNRNDSLDSRSTQIGLIDKREILGRVLFLALPGREPFTQKRDFSRIGVLK